MTENEYPADELGLIKNPKIFCRDYDRLVREFPSIKPYLDKRILYFQQNPFSENVKKLFLQKYKLEVVLENPDFQEKNVPDNEILYLEPESKKKENIFNKLHYSTDHLPLFHEFNSMIGLYGRHYIPIIKCRYYQLIGGILQSKISLGGCETDTRVHVAYPLVTEAGKNELIYAIKTLIKGGIKKSNNTLYSMSEPLSYSAESLIGKKVERIIPNPLGKPKTIRVNIENRGHFNNDFLEFDECSKLIFSNSPEDSQAREYISKSENPIGKNEVEKRLVDDLANESVKYFPYNTNSFYFQPFKKIPEEVMLQGFLRRKLIPVGDVSLFMISANETIITNKTAESSFSKQEYISRLAKHLETISFGFRGKEFFFTDEAKNLINQYALYLNAQGTQHSEKIENFCKLTKYTSLAYLIKFSVIISASYRTNIVNENAVSLAFMDLVEILQNTFNFISQRVLGNFDYGTSWNNANFYQKECLKYLYENRAFSFEESQISIEIFISEAIMPVFRVKETQARNKMREMKVLGLIDSKQDSQHSSKVWLNFSPSLPQNIIEGDKGVKGYNTYNTIYLTKKSIIEAMTSLSPLTP